MAQRMEGRRLDYRTSEQREADLAVAGRADCGCWYSAEDEIPCIHDLQLAGMESRRHD